MYAPNDVIPVMGGGLQSICRVARTRLPLACAAYPTRPNSPSDLTYRAHGLPSLKSTSTTALRPRGVTPTTAHHSRPVPPTLGDVDRRPVVGAGGGRVAQRLVVAPGGGGGGLAPHRTRPHLGRRRVDPERNLLARQRE